MDSLWKSGTTGSPLLLAYPLAYIFLDTFLVVFIKSTSVDGKNSYNSITANAITEFIKLCIAVTISYYENSLGEIFTINFDLFIRFAVPNLVYAINNNLFHYSVSALPPAVFIVSINAMRTIITSFCQKYISGKQLTNRQVIACGLLTMSFIVTSFPDIMQVVQTGQFRGSQLALLLTLSGLYSGLSVFASLAQERLLKDSKTLMSANIVNYSIGLTLQMFGVGYSAATTNDAIMRGFDVIWIQLIPFFMAFSGLSISFVLRYFDNIVKLICSSLAVLCVHAITSYLQGQPIVNVSFFLGWLLTLPAAYLYYVQPPAGESDKENSKISLKQKIGGFSAAVIIIFILTYLSSSSNSQNLRTER